MALARQLERSSPSVRARCKLVRAEVRVTLQRARVNPGEGLLAACLGRRSSLRLASWHVERIRISKRSWPSSPRQISTRAEKLSSQILWRRFLLPGRICVKRWLAVSTRRDCSPWGGPLNGRGFPSKRSRKVCTAGASSASPPRISPSWRRWRGSLWRAPGELLVGTSRRSRHGLPQLVSQDRPAVSGQRSLCCRGTSCVPLRYTKR